MMSNKTTNTFEAGLVRTNNPIKQPKNSYSFALNTVINDIVTDPTSRTNEKSLDLYYVPNADLTNLLGYIWLGNEEYVLFVKHKDGETSFNKILYINPPKNITTILYDNLLLNFQDRYEIKGTYRINYKNQRVIYWVDGLNDDRVLNIDMDSLSLDIALLSIGESAIKPIITTVSNDIGGSVTSGQYFFAMSYNLEDTLTTSIYSISRPISIAAEAYYNDPSLVIDDSLTAKFGDTDGDTLPATTNKSIEISIQNLDNKYTSFNLYVIKANSDGTFSIKKISDISTGISTYTYTGSQGVIDTSIDINNIIVDAIKYYASEAITQKENRLIRGNSKIKGSIINYQAIANNITVKYEIDEKLVYDSIIMNSIREDTDPELIINFSVARDAPKKHSIVPSYLANTGNDSLDNKTWMRDEIYSLGIGFELKDGSETDVFHIPGRVHNILSDTSGLGEYGRVYNPLWDTEIIDLNPYWKERNTASKAGILAYWRSNLTYTDGYGYPENGEQNVDNKSYIRHHKMPSDVLEPIFRTEVSGDPNAINTTAEYRIYKRNLKLVFENINIPDEYKDIISKIKIFYTPRTSENKSIVSKGILNGLYESEIEKEQGQQPEGTGRDDKKYFEFISPDTNFKFKQNSLSGSKIKVNSLYKGYIRYVGAVMSNIAYKPVHMIRIYNNPLKETTNRDQGLIMPTIHYAIPAIAKEELYSRKLNKSIYVDYNFSGVSEGISLNFNGSQPTSVLELIDSINMKPPSVIVPFGQYYPELFIDPAEDRSTVLFDQLEVEGLGQPWADGTYFDVSYYVSIINTNTELYGKTENLEYVNTTNFMADGSSIYSIITGSGDTFIETHHSRKSKIIPIDPSVPGLPDNNRAVYDVEQTSGFSIRDVNEKASNSYISYICETDINVRMRSVGEGLEGKYFPKSMVPASVAGQNAWRLYAENIASKQEYKLEKAYEKNYLKIYFANSSKLEDFNTGDNDIRFLTRIIYSDKQELEDKIDNYRKVRANNYRDLPLNRGPITTFFTKQDKLYCITRDSLYDVFASNQTIKSETVDNIVVGTGEFLSIEPTELVSIDGGYGGTSSKFSLTESPYGYLFVDRHKNKCLLFNEDLKDLNILGLNENFKIELYKQFPQLEATNGFDDPVINVGIISVYDPLLKRLIITKKDYKLIDTSGTITFENGYIYRDSIKLNYDDIDIFENKSFTVSYNPVHNNWISYHSYIPENYLSHNTDFLVYNNNILSKSNGNTYNTDFILETVFNEDPLNTKVTNSITVNLESYLNDVKYNDFFDELLVYNEMQCSDNIILNNTNTTKKEKDWNINKFLDKVKSQSNIQLFSTNWNDIKNNYYIDKVINPTIIDNNKPWYKLARFRDKYIKVRFTYKNLEMKKIIVNFVNSMYRISQR